jgi:hypothetical protein
VVRLIAARPLTFIGSFINVALYHHATGDGPTGDFSAHDLEHPFNRRRGLFRR